MSTTGGRVCVIGGGLAGISAALRLADRGAAVTLLEARRELGGATYSFRRGDLVADTGQHVFLRCYDRYRGLLRRLGTEDRTHLQERFAVPVLAPGRPVAWLMRIGGLPAPAHLLPGIAAYRLLRLPERLAALRAAAALRRVDPDDPATDTVSFGTWLAGQGQTRRAVERLWGLIAVAALNARPDDASLALAARVFRTGLLEATDAADIGRPLVPLSELHAQPAYRLLTRLGVAVHTATKVQGVTAAGGRYRVATAGGELDADGVVLAVPHPAAARLVPGQAAPERVNWQRLGSTPIVNIHVRYDRRVSTLPFAAAVDSPVQWIFARDDAHPEGPGQYLAVSLSAADDLVGRPAAELIATYLAALPALLPAARGASVRDAFVTREPHATFRQAPGTRAHRPPAETRLPGLVLAGAWTDTGWPDTMEGAVRSGRRAADALVAHLDSRPAARETAA